MRTWTRGAALIAAALVLGSAGVAWVADAPTTERKQGPLGMERPFREAIRDTVARLQALRDELALTPEQKVEIAKILKAHREEIVKAVQGVHAARTALLAEIRKDDYSERAIRRAADNLGDAIGNASVVRAAVRKEIRAVLTAEQQKKADAALEDIQEAWDQVIEDLGK